MNWFLLFSVLASARLIRRLAASIDSWKAEPMSSLSRIAVESHRLLSVDEPAALPSTPGSEPRPELRQVLLDELPDHAVPPEHLGEDA